MNILNLLEAQFQTKQKTSYSKSNRIGVGSDIHVSKKIGDGYDSTVIDNNPTHPHTVWKISNSFKKVPDGFNTFITYLIDHDLQDNPHFPRIYNIRNIKNSFNENVYVFETEKLLTYHDIKYDQLGLILDKCFAQEVTVEMYKNRSPYDITAHIAYMLTETILTNKNNYIIDKNLLNACEVIKQIIHTPVTYIDNFNKNISKPPFIGYSCW